MDNQTELIRKLLSNHSGFAIGEVHHERAALKFIIDNLALLKELGVGTIGLEIFKSEWSDDTLARFNSTGEMDILDNSDFHLTLDDRITFLDFKYAAKAHPTLKESDVPLTSLRDAYLFWKANRQNEAHPTVQLVSELITHEKTQPYNYRTLFEKAHALGINLVAVDSAALASDALVERVEKMDMYAAQQINKHAKDGKFVTLTGAAHTKGIAALLSVPEVHVLDKTEEKIYPKRAYLFGDQELIPDYLVTTRSREASNRFQLKA